jgi:hypothetical protein
MFSADLNKWISAVFIMKPLNKWKNRALPTSDIANILRQ